MGKKKYKKIPEATPEYAAMVWAMYPDVVVKNENEIKVNTNDSVVYPDAKLMDVGLRCYGPMEDSMYAGNLSLVEHIRWGNTWIQFECLL